MTKLVANIACFISAIGAINWGLKAFWDLDLVQYVCRLLGDIAYLDKIFYGVIAICGIIALLSIFVVSCCDG